VVEIDRGGEARCARVEIALRIECVLARRLDDGAIRLVL
jgi:hypothetical protein